jgi:hypothetical protein
LQGTTFTYLATDAYNAYVTATGAVYDANYTGLLAITEEQYAALEPLVFTIGSAGSFALSPNAQIWPRSLNAAIGGNDTAIYLIVADVSVLRQRSRLICAERVADRHVHRYRLRLHQWLYLPATVGSLVTSWRSINDTNSRFYTVFDTSNAQFGIAATEFTNATTN